LKAKQKRSKIHDVNDSPSDAKEAMEKDRLECAKLQAEIAAIDRPFFHRHEFYVAVAPVLLALIGITATWASGWFEVQRTRISNDKTLLQAQTTQLEIQKSSLAAEIETNKAYIHTLLINQDHLTNQISSLSNQMAALSRERDELQVARDEFREAAVKAAGSDSNAVRLLKQLIDLQAERTTVNQVVENMKTGIAVLESQPSKDMDAFRQINSRLAPILKENPGTRVFGRTLAIQLIVSERLPEWDIDLETNEAAIKTLDSALKTYDLFGIRRAGDTQ